MAAMTNSMSTFCSLMIFSFFLCSSTFHINADKTTHLHFYHHELYNETSFIVAGLGRNNSVFGNVRVFDNPLTETPDPSSALVGRSQGSTIKASLTDQSTLAISNFVFTSGEFNGSSLSLMGRVDGSGYADRTVVGGTGEFRLARGYALSKLVNLTSQYNIVEFEFYVTH